LLTEKTANVAGFVFATQNEYQAQDCKETFNIRSISRSVRDLLFTESYILVSILQSRQFFGGACGHKLLSRCSPCNNVGPYCVGSHCTLNNRACACPIPSVSLGANAVGMWPDACSAAPSVASRPGMAQARPRLPLPPLLRSWGLESTSANP
jgi:hypothetical protein